MDGATLSNLISKGSGVAARRAGTPYIVYRPSGIVNPLSTQNRIIKLCAKFAPFNGQGPGISGYSGLLWRGVFDSIYTVPGDYLANKSDALFVVSQWPLQPVLCIRTNCLISVKRPLLTDNGAYSGYVENSAGHVIDGWPALILASTARIMGTLPEAHFGNWYLFLPPSRAIFQVADIVTDDFERRFVVAAAQLSNLGWRLSMRQVEG